MSLSFHWPPGGRAELIGVSSGMRSERVSWFDQEYRSSIRRLLHQEYLAGEKYTHWEYCNLIVAHLYPQLDPKHNTTMKLIISLINSLMPVALLHDIYNSCLFLTS